MRIRPSQLLLLVAAAIALAIAHQGLAYAGVIAVTEADNGREFTLSRGDMVEVSLSATSGTGYTWQAVPNADALVKQVGDLRFKADNSMPGASGHQVFRFSVEAGGTGTLEFRYVRPWEKDTPPAKVFKILLIVK